MRRSQQPLNVFVDHESQICIAQEGSLHADPAIIVLDPTQVATLIEWLREAYAEIMRSNAGAEVGQ